MRPSLRRNRKCKGKLNNIEYLCRNVLKVVRTMSRCSLCCVAWLVCAACQSKGPQAPPNVSIAPSNGAASPGASAAATPPPQASVPALPPHLPAEFDVAENTRLALAARGKGVQIYGCSPKTDDPSAFEWKLTAPEAELFDEQGRKVAKHFAGPTWEATDGSRVVGTVVHKLDAPDPDAIPWLLIAGKRPAGSGPGVFDAIARIARLDTKGGKAPAEGCDAAHAHAEVRVPYEASYYFYTPPS